MVTGKGWEWTGRGASGVGRRDLKGGNRPHAKTVGVKDSRTADELLRRKAVMSFSLPKKNTLTESLSYGCESILFNRVHQQQYTLNDHLHMEAFKHYHGQ